MYTYKNIHLYVYIYIYIYIYSLGGGTGAAWWTRPLLLYRSPPHPVSPCSATGSARSLPTTPPRVPTWGMTSFKIFLSRKNGSIWCWLSHVYHTVENSTPVRCREGTPSNVFRTFVWKPRPESGHDCLVCAEYARFRALRLGPRDLFQQSLRVSQPAQKLKSSRRMLPEKGLKPRPESGLDCLMCAEFAGLLICARFARFVSVLWDWIRPISSKSASGCPNLSNNFNDSKTNKMDQSGLDCLMCAEFAR
jgi:hypothetical protein